MDFNILSKARILNGKLLQDTANYLIRKFRQSALLFSYASVHGQLHIFMTNFSQLLFYFIKDSTLQSNIDTANRAQSVAGISTLTGHNPSRGRAATGEIKIGIAAGASIDSIPGGVITLFNFQKVICQSNGFPYLLDLGQDSIDINLMSTTSFTCRVIEGEYTNQVFTGSGEDLQSYNLNASLNQAIDDNRIIVEVNGTIYPVYSALIDIPNGKPGVMVRTSIVNGITVIFGNQINNKIPLAGERIIVNYLQCHGSLGNLWETYETQWRFADSAMDILGNDVNMNEMFVIGTTYPPDFGSDPESMDQVRYNAPRITKNAVVHDKDSIIYYFLKMNYFSTVSVFRDDTLDNQNVYNTMLVPRLKDRIAAGTDYFNCDMTLLLLTNEEQKRILESITDISFKSANILIKLVQPKVHYFTVTIMADIFKVVNGRSVTFDDVNKKIRIAMSDYFIESKRTNEYPVSDIVQVIKEKVVEVDSLQVVFNAQYEEDINQYGDVEVPLDAILVCRGGFIDYNGIEWEDQFNSDENSQGSVNIELAFEEEGVF